VAAWAALILALSTDSFSSQNTSRIVGPLLDLLFPGLGAETRTAVHAAVRKSAHVVEYAVLAVLAWHACLLGRRAHALRAAGVALLLVLAVAGLDEAGQARRAARTGSVRDVALDTAGGALALAGAALWRGARRRRRGTRRGPTAPA